MGVSPPTEPSLARSVPDTVSSSFFFLNWVHFSRSSAENLRELGYSTAFGSSGFMLQLGTSISHSVLNVSVHRLVQQVLNYY
jgi:hypothetical protein